MPLGMKVSLGSGHIVLDGDPAPPPIKRSTAPIFGSCLLWPNGRPSQLLLSTCCTADGGEFLSLTTGRDQTSAYKLPNDVGVSGSRLIHGFLGHTGVHIP